MAVAPRHLGWRSVEIVGGDPRTELRLSGKGIRQFWGQLPRDRDKRAFYRSDPAEYPVDLNQILTKCYLRPEAERLVEIGPNAAVRALVCWLHRDAAY